MMIGGKCGRTKQKMNADLKLSSILWLFYSYFVLYNSLQSTLRYLVSSLLSGLLSVVISPQS